MFGKLKELLNNSYTPYYNYRVSAVIVTNDNNEFEGVNVETSSPAAGICAERNAIYSAIAKGYNKGDFKELHVMVEGEKGAKPCFICRQTLVDFTNEDMPVFLYTKNGLNEKLTIKELTPFPFDKGDLKWNLALYQLLADQM